MNSGSGRSETLLVTEPSARRLDVFLRREFPSESRTALLRMIREGHVRVDGQVVKPSHVPRSGQRIAVIWPEPKRAEPAPLQMALEVLYEDDALLVLNKPAGLVVHPGAGHQEGTLVNALLHHCRGQLSGIGGVARPGIVHRLDRDTSGLMVVAKNDAGHIALSEQFAQRGVEKVYHAIVCGRLKPETGEIHAPIARHPSHRHMMTVSIGGRPAVTSYATIESLAGATLVEARLHTGRTHQVRVHFKHIGFPLVGDVTYGKGPNSWLVENTGYVAGRQMLHARRLGFTHPVNRRFLTFEAPWPPDFASAVEVLRHA